MIGDLGCCLHMVCAAQQCCFKQEGQSIVNLRNWMEHAFVLRQHFECMLLVCCVLSCRVLSHFYNELLVLQFLVSPALFVVEQHNIINSTDR